jgi:hypothetical protein
MSLQSMVAELRGTVPKIPVPYLRTLVNRAYKEIRDRNLWSFQLAEGQWISPQMITAGTATTTQGSNVVQMDSVAAAAINANGSAPYSLLTQRQFRIGAGGIYNIYGWDGVSALTLDRMYGELSVTSASYFIYQVYYPSPTKTFLRFISVRDMQNFLDLFIATTREELDQLDPQRDFYTYPTRVVPYKPDPNPQSATYGYMLHELWGAPQYSLNYQLLYIDKLGDLMNPNDMLPYAIGEDVVLAKARVYAYEWAEGNKGALERNQGPDYRFLMGASEKQYETLFKNYRREDRETVDNFFMAGRTSLYGRYWASYNSLSGTANPGGFW